MSLFQEGGALLFAAQAVGIVAVALFVLSYQLKRRNSIILCNATSRSLYIVQYLLLFAFEGAVLDVLGLISSVLAQKKDTPFLKKYRIPVLVAINLSLVAATVLLWQNIFSLFPLLGVLLHTSAFWITDEKKIRLLSFFGSPFWLAYNLYALAIGSAVGDALTICSIGLAILRYDILKKSNEKDAV